MKNSTLLLILIVTLMSCGTKDKSSRLIVKPQADKQIAADWKLDKVKGGKLLFTNGEIFETKLFDLEYVGQISNENKLPYLIFSGRDCENCGANISLYVHSPSDGQLIVGDGQNAFSYAGTTSDYESGSTISKTRVFYGQVLGDLEGVIWYDSTLTDDNSWSATTYLCYKSDGRLKDSTITDYSNIDKTLTLKTKGLCKEIAGKKFTSEP